MISTMHIIYTTQSLLKDRIGLEYPVLNDDDDGLKQYNYFLKLQYKTIIHVLVCVTIDHCNGNK